MNKNWFSVDRAGLAKLLEKRGKVFAIFELMQNAWDTGAGHVDVTLEKLPGRPFANLIVKDDDPDGFTDLAHAYTLFAESEKKGDPTKRGRFNLGEKLVLALCRDASIVSTKGSVTFNSNGTRNSDNTRKTEKGSVFSARIRMTVVEYDEVVERIDHLIVPLGVITTFNGRELESRQREATFRASLMTLVADEEGNLSKKPRKTEVHVYAVQEGEVASIYEMGIPVVETGDTFHVDVQQKVPVNLDRDNVPPAYLAKLRVEVLNALHEELEVEDMKETWVTVAISHRDVVGEAVNSTLDGRFGKKRAIFDASDPEANQTLTAQGYTVIAGGSLPKAAWTNVRSSGAALPSGRIRPTPKAFEGGEGAKMAEFLSESEWFYDMAQVVAVVRKLAPKLIGREVSVKICTNSTEKWAACYGNGELVFSLKRLKKQWFNWKMNRPAILELVIHEFAHAKVDSHLDYKFQAECCRIGAALAVLCERHSLFFQVYPRQ